MCPVVRRKLVDAKVTDAEKRRYPSKHYVYIIQVTWDDGSSTVIFRRYSKFFDFQISLLETFPHEGGIKDPSDRVIPFLPGKILFRRSNIRDVAMKRLKPIDEYCSSLLKLPTHIKESSQVLDFFESKPEDLNPIKEESFSKRKRNEEDIGEISGPITLEQYTAVADYTRTQPKELSVISGQMLEVIEKNENGWWFVSDLEGERGWVPGVYLEKLDGTSENLVTKEAIEGEGEKYITTSQFSGGEEEVGFGVGVIVEVLQKNLEGWWLISYNGKKGWAPASYLERTSDSVLRGRRVTNWGQHRRSLPSNSINTTTPSPLSHPQPSSTSSSPKRKVDIKQNTSVAAVAAAFSSNRTQPPPKRSTLRRGSQKPKEPPPLPPSPVSSEPVYEYVTAATFNAQIPDGISFKENKKIKVLEKSPGDWWYIEVDGCEGWAPASYIEKQFKPPRPKPPVDVKKSLGPKKSDPIRSLSPVQLVKNDPVTSDPEYLKPSRVKMLGIDSTPVNLEPKASPAKRPLPNLPGAKPITTTTLKPDENSIKKVPSIKKIEKPKIIPMKKEVKDDVIKRNASPQRPSYQPNLKGKVNSQTPPKPTSLAQKKTTGLPNKSINKPQIARKESATPEPGKIDFRSHLKPVGKKPSLSHKDNKPTVTKPHPIVAKQPSTVNKQPSIGPKKPSTFVAKRPSTQPSKFGVSKQPTKPSVAPFKSKPLDKPKPLLPSNKPRPPKTKPVLNRLTNSNDNNNGDKIVGHVQLDVTPSLPLPKGMGEELLGDKYFAIADFQPENENEAGFKKGTEVVLVEKSKNNWWYVKIGDRHGWVPAGYFEQVSGSADSGIIEDNQGNPPSREILTDLSLNINEPIYSEIDLDEVPPSGGTHRVLSSFAASDDTMLSVAAEEIVEVLEESDSGWWFVRGSNMGEGWVPAEYLEKI